MRALTLTQPWAGLVASGIKLIENRPRHMIKRSDFGTPFAIHASRVIDEAVYDRIRELDPGLFTDHVIDTWHERSRVTSAILATAIIDHVIDPLAHGILPGLPDALTAIADDQRRWFFGPIAYALRDVRTLPLPVPCRGRQGFWTAPESVTRDVRRQLEAGTP